MTTVPSSRISEPNPISRPTGLGQGYSIAPIYRCDNRPDYRRWSIEELRVFAAQMQWPNAARKSRRELLAFFGVPGE